MYARISRRFASFILDTFVINIVLLCIYFILYALSAFAPVHTLYKQVSTQVHAVSSLGLSTELVFSYVIGFSLYIFLCLFFFGKSLGMWIMEIQFVSSSPTGDPHPLSIPQKFLRGFIGNILGFLLFFIPTVPNLFELYKRSIMDRIAGTYVLQEGENKRRDMLAYVVIALFIILVLYVNLNSIMA